MLGDVLWCANTNSAVLLGWACFGKQKPLMPSPLAACNLLTAGCVWQCEYVGQKRVLPRPVLANTTSAK